MKTFRIYYWLGSCTTERYVKARSKSEAVRLFSKQTNPENIINIEEA